MLSIETYDQREREELRTASYRAISSFAPVYFHRTGFPTRVSHESELRRYVDIMGEMTPRTEWRKTRRHTQREADTMVKVADHVVKLTGRLFEKPVYPLIGLWAPITMLRMVQYLSEVAGRPLVVMDVGAGCGYLDLYLLNAGHRVIVVDTTQALYLWQNRLFHTNSLKEWAQFHPDFKNLAHDHLVNHIPWWCFANLFKYVDLFKIDVVICDAALAEMDWFAACYTMKLAKECTKDSPVGCLLYRNIGDSKLGHEEQQILEYAHRIGFKPYRMVNAPDGMVVLANQQHKKVELSAPPPWGSEANLLIDEFLEIKQDMVAESYAFCDFINVGT